MSPFLEYKTALSPLTSLAPKPIVLSATITSDKFTVPALALYMFVLYVSLSFDITEFPK